ncbi:hypothetical protein L1887_46947 [Cichorium endivia]|nr:hypothetical protein L1887_46947 [Cichorium endivia]
MNIGAAIRKVRLEKGLTLEAVALEVGTYAGNLSKIERSQQLPSLELLHRLSRALGTKTSELYTVAESESEESEERTSEHGNEVILSGPEVRRSILGMTRNAQQKMHRAASVRPFAAELRPPEHPPQHVQMLYARLAGAVVLAGKPLAVVTVQAQGAIAALAQAVDAQVAVVQHGVEFTVDHPGRRPGRDRRQGGRGPGGAGAGSGCRGRPTGARASCGNASCTSPSPWLLRALWSGGSRIDPRLSPRLIRGSGVLCLGPSPVRSHLLRTHNISDAHEKAPRMRGFFTAGSLALVGSDRLGDLGAGRVSVAPAIDLDPFAFLEILVVLEEVLDLLQQQGWQVGVFLHVDVQLRQLVVRYGDDLGIAAAVVGHVQHADRTGADHRAWRDRVRGHDQHVQGITVVGQGVRDETVVGRVEHRGGHEAVNEQAVAVLVDLVFDRRVVGRDLDGDVDVVRQVFARRDLAVAHWAFFVERVAGLQFLQAGQRILAVETAQLPVDRGVRLHQQVGGGEEVLAGDGEEFCRVFRRVGVDGRLGVGVAVELAVEVVVGLLHGLGPVTDAHVGVQWRQAVGVAVEHVQLVRQFVDHQVVAFPAAAALHPGPGHDHRALLPGLAAVLGVPFVLDAAAVAMALRADEVVGVEDQFVEALVPVQRPQVQQRQLGLGGEEQALAVIQLDAWQAGQVLVVQEQHAGFAQPEVLGFAEAVQDRQALAHLPPQLGIDRVSCDRTAPAPGAEAPHVRRSVCLGLATTQAAADHADDHRHQRQQDDGDDHQRQVLLDERYVAEEVAEGHQAADPKDGAGHAEAEEARVGHVGDAGDERREGAQDRQEARQGHGLAAMALVEIVSLLEVVAAEDLRVGVVEQPFSCRSSDHVVGAVTHDCRKHQQAAEQHRVHAATRGHGAGDEQQGVAGQEGHHHQAGFAEDHHEQDRVDPGTIVVDQQVEVGVEMQNEVQRVEIHVQHLVQDPDSRACDGWQCGGLNVRCGRRDADPVGAGLPAIAVVGSPSQSRRSGKPAPTRSASCFSVDRQDVVLELGVLAEPDRLVGAHRHFIVAAGRHPHAHGIGVLGHALGFAHQVVGHQHAPGVLGDVDVVEDPHALERQGGKTRVQLAEPHQFAVVVIRQGQIDHRFAALQAFLQERTGSIRVGQPRLSGELRPGRSPIRITVIRAPSSSPISSATATRPCSTSITGAVDQPSPAICSSRRLRNGRVCRCNRQGRETVGDHDGQVDPRPGCCVHVRGGCRRSPHAGAGPGPGAAGSDGGPGRRCAAAGCRGRAPATARAGRHGRRAGAPRRGPGRGRTGNPAAAGSAGWCRHGPGRSAPGVRRRSSSQGLSVGVGCLSMRSLAYPSCARAWRKAEGVVEGGGLVVEHDVVGAGDAHDEVDPGHPEQGQQGVHVVLVGLGVVGVADVAAHGHAEQLAAEVVLEPGADDLLAVVQRAALAGLEVHQVLPEGAAIQAQARVIPFLQHIQIDPETGVGRLGAGDGLEHQVQRHATVDGLDRGGDVGQHAGLGGNVIALDDGVEHLQQGADRGDAVGGRVDADHGVTVAVEQAVEDARGDPRRFVGGVVGLQAGRQAPAQPHGAAETGDHTDLLRHQDQVLHAHDLRHRRGHFRGQARGQGAQAGFVGLIAQQPVAQAADGQVADRGEGLLVVGVDDQPERRRSTGGAVFPSVQGFFGLLDRGELFLRRAGHQVMAAVQGEVGDQHAVDDGGADHHPRVHQEAGDHRQAGQHQGHAGGEDAARGAVRTLHLGAADAQGDVRGHHQYIGQRSAEHRHQDQQVTLAGQRQGETDDAGDDQGEHRRLALVGLRQRAGQVAGAGQGEDLPGIGVDDREEAGDQPGQADQRFGAGAARADHQDQQGEGEQHQHGADQAAGQVTLGVLGFLGGQRHAFDGEEEPDRIGDRRPHADIAEGQEAAGADGLGGDDVEQVLCIEMGHHRQQEHRQGDGRHCGDDEHQLERFTDAEDVDADEDDVEGQVDHPAADAEQRLAVGADEHRDGCGCDGVFDKDRGAGEEAAPGPERAAGEAVHGGHQQGGEEHAAPTALGQAEVPAGVVAGNHVGDPQAHQQDPAGSAFFQFTLLEVVGADLFEIYGRACRRAGGVIARHESHLLFF